MKTQGQWATVSCLLLTGKTKDPFNRTGKSYGSETFIQISSRNLFDGGGEGGGGSVQDEGIGPWIFISMHYFSMPQLFIKGGGETVLREWIFFY